MLMGTLSFAAMRKLAPIVLLLAISCTTPNAPAPVTPATDPAGPYGMTVAEEARILALEDRREYDPAVVASFVKHENSLHRRRIALALGRIGPHTFIDSNGTSEFDPPVEKRAGVAELLALSGDPDRGVREMVAFALGEIGDPSAADALLTLTTDPDSSVAAEAIEALSKFANDPQFVRDRFGRYLWLVDPQWPEGLRARATRFLFRFQTDEALAAATAALGSPSAAVRQEGAYALSRRAGPNARPQLELLLSDPGVLTRAYAAAALGRIADAASIPALMTSLGDVHPWVRTNAAVALGRIYEKTPAAAEGRGGDLPRIFAALEDPDPGVRASTVDVLGFYAARNLQDARLRLLSIRENGTQTERELATRAVMRHFGPEAFAASWPTDPWQISRMLEANTNPTVRRRHAKHESPLVRTAVLASIPNAAVAGEIETIRALLNDPDVIVRANAIEKYAQSHVDDDRTWFATLDEIELRERKSEMNDARLAAITALADRYRPQRPGMLHALLSDSDPVVRRVAADLIVDKLGARRPQYTPLPVTRTQAEYEEIIRWSRQPHTATIHMTRGKIELALLAQDAPMTAWNFAQLAQKKFFDNTTFMRVVPNFVIQGGDPRNDMNGGPGYAIRDEINLQKYTRGAVGMALSGPDTGGSQFFIVHSPQPHLDGGYTIFARAYEGVSSVVDQTERGDRVQTITIDEHPPVGAEQIGSVPAVTLPLVIGPITPEQLIQTVPSYAQRRTDYTPDVTVLEMMKSYVRAGDRVEVYMGTWCDDSQREVPKFLRISDDLKSQFGVDLPVTFVAVDRAKHEPAKLLEGKSVDKVATFIYYRGGQELGRIVERPTGLFEDDLLTIVAKQ
jgi:cyclophilin family peptidyl-prolyl cis-trans isomerase/HEAT repeat protein/thiol-disulfide isomerase/thioredoxin